MKPNWAEENLQTIRTLMERSALYRRALAPLMIWAGALGICAAAAGCYWQIESSAGFIAYWMVVAVLVMVGAFVLVRRQAIKSAEPFWSPPTCRVAQAISVPLTIGFALGLLVLIAWIKDASGVQVDPPTGMRNDAGELFWLPAVWALFYGCALHAAGFFAAGSLRRFAWVFIVCALGVLVWLFVSQRQDCPLASWQGSHWLMGALFGGLQLIYGIYLFVTEKFDL
jgi:hypothetical protein